MKSASIPPAHKLEKVIKPSKEEMAYRLVRLYFEEVARLGSKHKLNFDAVMNAYFYALGRIRRQEIEIGLLAEHLEEIENKLSVAHKEDLFPESDSPK